MHSFPDVNEYI